MAVLRNARATSAGGVVHRTVEDRIEILLVHRRSPRLWALPKGTPDAGETIEETALRETREETGIEVEVEAPLRSIRYFFVRSSTRFHKTVHFFLMRPIGGSIEAHDAEFDEVRWVAGHEALALLTHATERSVVEQALEVIAARATAGRTLPSAEATA
ncbi:MAG TPA: NUDIX hydrolase [Candidatus Limnocylindrales bacterium]|nr:NUDIX hydrolase [Candidatus Limnocylindrales bacterium]